MAIKDYMARAVCMALIMGLSMLSYAFGETDKDKKINKLKGMNYKEVIKKIRTPTEAEWYIRHYIIQEGSEADIAKSFRVIHETRKGDCSEGVVGAAALLSDNGYKPTWLFLEDSTGKKGNHGVFLYQKNGKWGTIGINAKDNSPPRYESLEGIAKGLGYDKYEIKQLKEADKLGIWTSWIDSSRDLYGSGKSFAEQK